MGELLFIEQHILNESETRRNKSSYDVNWLKNAFDMVPQSKLLHCLKMYKIPDEIIKFIEQTMENWRGELTAWVKSLPEVEIQKCIF